MFTKKTIKDVDVKDKTILLRVDYNVPIKDGQVSDDYRVKQSLPTLHYLLEQNARLILCAHLGRPDGKPNPELSLKPVAAVLEGLINRPVKFAADCVGQPAEEAVKDLKNGEILLLENLRFHPEEEANDQNFAKQLVNGADLFVQDGFGVVHRAHASTEAITHFLPSVAGLLLDQLP